MKKLTLDKTWDLCVNGMWPSIVRSIKRGTSFNVNELKRRWMERHEFDKVDSDCFFCEYDWQRRRENNWDSEMCSYCPGKLVSRRFHCENHSTYSWLLNTIAFYKKLVELNKKRKARKK